MKAEITVNTVSTIPDHNEPSTSVCHTPTAIETSMYQPTDADWDDYGEWLSEQNEEPTLSCQEMSEVYDAEHPQQCAGGCELPY